MSHHQHAAYSFRQNYDPTPDNPWQTNRHADLEGRRTRQELEQLQGYAVTWYGWRGRVANDERPASPDEVLEWLSLEAINARAGSPVVQEHDRPFLHRMALACVELMEPHHYKEQA